MTVLLIIIVWIGCTIAYAKLPEKFTKKMEVLNNGKDYTIRSCTSINQST